MKQEVIELNNQSYEINFLNAEEVRNILDDSRFTLSFIRILDFLSSLLGSIVLIPLFLIIAFAIKIDSKGPILYKQERIGKNLEPFNILKFRTMIVNAEKKGLSITTSGDKRITKVGKFLRKTKLDELPQLINVIKGDMSIVGSRPEVKKYVDIYEEVFSSILMLRPGITDLASIEFRDEEELMSLSENAEQLYIDKIMKIKLSLNFAYINMLSLKSYFTVIFRTFMKIVG